MTGQNVLRLLLVFVPVSFYLGMTHASATWVFVFACLAMDWQFGQPSVAFARSQTYQASRFPRRET